MARLVWTLLRLDWRQTRRYPAQFALRLVLALSMLYGFAVATSYTNRSALLASFLGVLVTAAALNALYKASTGFGEGELSREEPFLYPYPPGVVQAGVALSMSWITVMAGVVAYALAARDPLSLGVGVLYVALAVLAGMGLGLVFFGLSLLFVKIEGLVPLAVLAVFSLAFAPLGQAPAYLDYLPIVNVIRAAQGAGTAAGVLVLTNLLLLAGGLAVAHGCEREVVRRGIAALE